MYLNNQHNKKYYFNENFFEIIDSEEKAYWLGYLTADGTIDIEKNEISLTSKDIEHLELYKKSLDCDKDIKYVLVKYGVVTLHNKKTVCDLTKYGFHNNKTYTLKPPPDNTIPSNLLNHYIRGFFDGDGCLTSTINKLNRIKPKINFVCGSKDYLEWIKVILKTKSNVCFKKSKKRIVNHYNLDIGGIKETLRLMDWIYKKSTIFMQRKYDKYLNIKSQILIDYGQDNRRENKYIKKYTAFGEEKTMREWSRDDRCKVPLETMKSRYFSKKYCLEVAMTKPFRTIENGKVKFTLIENKKEKLNPLYKV